jgi:uncharacterized membrane-anchored protein YjiN (DUF445 family)
MEILGIGPMELFFILIIALIVLGPNDMVKAGRTMGRFLRKVVTHPAWQMIQQTSRDLRYLPNKLIRDAGLEETLEGIKKDIPDPRRITQEMGIEAATKEVNSVQEEVYQDLNLSDWTTTPLTIDSPPPPDQTILPPAKSEPIPPAEKE